MLSRVTSLVGQHQGADLAVGAVAGGDLDGVGHGLGVGVGELQVEVGGWRSG